MKVTIADIAKKANVSKMTVSRVINGSGPVKEETAERIRQIIKELHYQPNLIARSLSSKRSNTVGVIIPKVKQVFLDSYIAEISSGITETVLERDYRMMLFPVEIDSKRNSDYLNIVRSHIADGLIILKSKINDPNISLLVENKIPFLLVNHKKYKKKYNFIDTENITGAKMAVEYLYGLGHRDIAFISGSMDETNSIDRLKGYQSALKRLNLDYNPEWIINGDFCKEKAYEGVGRLLKLKKRPTAIFCSDDYMAIGAIERLKKEGLSVPADMSVIGFDDIELAAYYKPALSTIRQPLLELGKMAANYLIDIIEGKQKSLVRKFLKVKLIKRASCRAL